MSTALEPLLGTAAIRGAVLLGLTLVALPFLKRFSAAVRHQVCAGVLLAVALLPLLSVSLPAWKVLPSEVPAQRVVIQAPNKLFLSPEKTFASQDNSAPVSSVGETSLPSIPKASSEPDSNTASSVVRGSWNWPSWRKSLMVIWITGVSIGIIDLILSALELRRLTRAAKPWKDEKGHWASLFAQSSTSRLPRILLGNQEDGPLVWGLRHPVILLPQSATSWSLERLHAVLQHELAHVRRQDCLMQMLAAITVVLHWFNPLAWLILRRLRQEAERACDDCTLRSQVAATEYAEHLLAVAAGGRPLPSLAPSMARPSGLRQRVAAVLDQGIRRNAVSPATKLGITGVMLALGLPLAIAQRAENKVPPIIAKAVESLDTKSGRRLQIIDREAGESKNGSETSASQRKLAHITIVALDVEGRSVAGATIRGLQTNMRGPMTPFDPSFEGTTDAEGRWQGEVPFGDYMVLVTTDTLTNNTGETSEFWWGLRKEKPVQEFRVPLIKGSTVRVTVKDAASQAPIPNAYLLLESTHIARTDAKGEAVWHNVPQGEHTVKVVAPPMADKNIAFNNLQQSETQVAVNMVPGFEVRGQVLDTEGKPVVGALVRDYYSGSIAHCYMRRFITDAEGRYQLGWYAKNDKVWLMGAEHKDYAKSLKNDQQPPLEGNTAQCDFILTPGYQITGTVKDQTGKAIAGASVRYGRSPSLVDARTTKTGEDGGFTLNRIAKNRQDVVIVQASGHAPSFLEATPAQGNEVPKLAFALAPGLVVKGRVIDRTGQPVEKVQISPQFRTTTFDYVGEGTVSAKDGTFELRDIAKTGVALDAYASHISAVRRFEYDPTKPLEIVVDRPGIVMGQVIDAETRKPIRSFNVRISFPKEKRGEDEPQASYSAHLSRRGQECQSADGHFIIEDLISRAGHAVTITADGYAVGYADKILARPQDDPSWPFVFELKRGKAHPGSVWDASTGKPIAGARVLISESSDDAKLPAPLSMNMLSDYRDYNDLKDFVSLQSDATGVFNAHFQDQRKPLTVIVTADGYAPMFGTRGADEGLRIELQPAASLKLDLQKRDATQLAGCRVSLSTDRMSYDQAELRKDGTIEIGGLSGGRIALRVDTPTKHVLGALLDLKPGVVNEIRLDQIPSTRLKVRLLLDGAPVEGNVYISTALSGGITGSETATIGTLSVDEEGVADFERLSPVPVNVFVTDLGIDRSRKVRLEKGVDTVDLSQAGPHEVEIRYVSKK